MGGKYKKVCAIYGIFCKTTGKAYIGSSNRIGLRKWKHFSALSGNTHHSIKLQRSWNRHSPFEFVFSIIEFCPEESLIRREQFYIDAWDAYNNGYNGRPIAESSRGAKRSPEAIFKFKKTMQERYGGSPRKGTTSSEETKALIRAARAKQAPTSAKIRMMLRKRMLGNTYRLGIKHTAEWVQSRKGMHLSPDTEFKSGRTYVPAPETLAKISVALSGRKLSEDHRRKLSESHTGLPPNRVKTYKFMSPSGELIVITNLAQFCKEYGLSAPHMNSVFHGKREIHKGWRRHDGTGIIGALHSGDRKF